MLQKERFADDRAGTCGSHDPDDRDDQVSHQDEPIAHAANNGWGRGVRKSMTQSSTAADLQFAMDTMLLTRASFAVRAAERWSAMLYVENLNDTHNSPSRNLLYSNFNLRIRPRTAGVQLDYRFD